MSGRRDYQSSRPESPPPPYESRYSQSSYHDRPGYADTRRSARNDNHGQASSPRPRPPFPSYEDRHTESSYNDRRNNDVRGDAYNDQYGLAPTSDLFPEADRAGPPSARPYDSMTSRYPSPPARARTPPSDRQFDSSRYDPPSSPPIDRGFEASTGPPNRRENDNWHGGQHSSMSQYDTMRCRSPAPAPAAEERGLTWINVHADGKFCGCDRCNAARAGRPTIEEEMAADYRAKGFTMSNDNYHDRGPHERAAARAGNPCDPYDPLNRRSQRLSGRKSISPYGRRADRYDFGGYEFSWKDFMFDDHTVRSLFRR